jgi:hypothetical protein
MRFALTKYLYNKRSEVAETWLAGVRHLGPEGVQRLLNFMGFQFLTEGSSSPHTEARCNARPRGVGSNLTTHRPELEARKRLSVEELFGGSASHTSLHSTVSSVPCMFSARATPDSTSFCNGRGRYWLRSAEIPRYQTASGRISNSHQQTSSRPGITPGPNPLPHHSLVEEEPSRASTSGANATISPQRFHSPVDQRRIGRCRASAHHSSAFEGPHLPPSLLSPCPASAGTVSAIARRRSLPPPSSALASTRGWIFARESQQTAARPLGLFLGDT